MDMLLNCSLRRGPLACLEFSAGTVLPSHRGGCTRFNVSTRLSHRLTRDGDGGVHAQLSSLVVLFRARYCVKQPSASESRPVGCAVLRLNDLPIRVNKSQRCQPDIPPTDTFYTLSSILLQSYTPEPWNQPHPRDASNMASHHLVRRGGLHLLPLGITHGTIQSVSNSTEGEFSVGSSFVSAAFFLAVFGAFRGMGRCGMSRYDGDGRCYILAILGALRGQGGGCVGRADTMGIEVS